jgi:hypothetical protein
MVEFGEVVVFGDAGEAKVWLGFSSFPCADGEVG